MLRLPLWSAPVVCPCGLPLWSAPVVCPCGLSLWSAPVVCPYGLPLWSAPMVCPYGLPLWSAPMVCPYGLPLCSSLTPTTDLSHGCFHDSTNAEETGGDGHIGLKPIKSSQKRLKLQPSHMWRTCQVKPQRSVVTGELSTIRRAERCNRNRSTGSAACLPAASPRGKADNH
ncbi:hypothetical protein NQZ68_029241 [Dissostichus eleginoides]|nr:hypothetical protein NQZ68_029241 [Dissostichus eleginoides]